MKTRWPELLAALTALAAIQVWLLPLLPVDETRYLAVAWEMWHRGDLLVPWLNGEPYSHKPPLLFWLIQGLWALFGISAPVARGLVFALALAALWATARLGQRLWPHRPGASVLALWLLAGSLFWHNFQVLIQFDLLLTLCALAGWAGIWRAALGETRGWWWLGLALGLGILAKGPVIFLHLLPVAVLAPLWHPEWPERTGCWYAGVTGAVIIGVSIALAWAMPAGMAGGEAYRQAIFWGQSAGRVVNSFAHRAPWWSYLWMLPLMWLPWLVWPGLWRRVRAGLRHSAGAGGRGAGRGWYSLDSGLRFCLSVLLPALVLFSLVSGKQAKYLLPLMPLVALWLGRLLSGSGEARAVPRLRPAGAVIWLVLVGGVLTALPWLHLLGPGVVPERLAWIREVQPAWGPALLLWALALSRLQLPLPDALRVTALAGVVSSAVLWLGVLSLARVPYDLRAPAARAAELEAQGVPLAWLGKYQGQLHFHGRLRQRIEPLADRAALEFWLAAHPRGAVLATPRRRPAGLPRGVQYWPYRGRWLVLWPASVLRGSSGWLDAVAPNA